MMSFRRGDTIIEVMLAMSVIGIVLGAAFGIANRSIAIGQDAQERTEALTIAETQLELFKSQYPLPTPSSAALRARQESDPFCFNVSSREILDDSNCVGISPTGSDGLYTVRIVPPGAVDITGSYTIEVTWQRLGGGSSESGQNSLILYYKPGEI